MMYVFTAHLEARDPTRNRFRAYRIEAGTDLFGTWLVDAIYGRIGARGRTVRHVADDEAAARRIVRQCLQRRATAPRRIGIAYQLRELHDPGHWIAHTGIPGRITGIPGRIDAGAATVDPFNRPSSRP